LASTQPMPSIRHAADLPDALIATLGLPPRSAASPPEPTDCCDNSNL
jgi:hypothetical protein